MAVKPKAEPVEEAEVAPEGTMIERMAKVAKERKKLSPPENK